MGFLGRRSDEIQKKRMGHPPVTPAISLKMTDPTLETTTTTKNSKYLIRIVNKVNKYIHNFLTNIFQFKHNINQEHLPNPSQGGSDKVTGCHETPWCGTLENSSSPCYMYVLPLALRSTAQEVNFSRNLIPLLIYT